MDIYIDEDSYYNSLQARLEEEIGKFQQLEPTLTSGPRFVLKKTVKTAKHVIKVPGWKWYL